MEEVEVKLNIIQKAIKNKIPDYDFGRERFSAGTYLKLDNFAEMIVVESALEYVSAYVIKPGFNLAAGYVERFPYSELPNIRKGEFKPIDYPIRKKIWRVYDVVENHINDMLLLLTDYDENHQTFTAFVLEDTKHNYYKHTRISVPDIYATYRQNLKGVRK